tara:strand:- start:459 stop:830 length:372 start_codon:yes stop_codon:yes gene_type:complete
MVIIYAFMILIMYILAGINKATNFESTVNGFKKVFFIKNLPKGFYKLTILLVIILEIFAPLTILYSLQTDKYNYMANLSSISLAIFTILATLIYHFPPVGSEYYSFMKNLTATGSLLLLSTLF